MKWWKVFHQTIVKVLHPFHCKKSKKRFRQYTRHRLLRDNSIDNNKRSLFIEYWIDRQFKKIVSVSNVLTTIVALLADIITEFQCLAITSSSSTSEFHSDFPCVHTKWWNCLMVKLPVFYIETSTINKSTEKPFWQISHKVSMFW